MVLSKLKTMAVLLVLSLSASTCVVWGTGPKSCPDEKETKQVSLSPSGEAKVGGEANGKAVVDVHGDPLPSGVVARLGTTRLRHSDDVTFVAFGADGKTLITAGHDNTIRLWDLATGKEIRRFAPPIPPKIKKRAYLNSADEDSAEERVQWFIQEGYVKGSLPVALAPDGKTLAASSGNVIQLWEVKTGKKIRQMQGEAVKMDELLFSPDSRTLAARNVDNILYLWASDSGKEIHQVELPSRQAGTRQTMRQNRVGNLAHPRLAFAPDGKSLAVMGFETEEEITTSVVKFWDVASGKEIRQIKAPKGVYASAVALAPGGKILAFGGNSIHLCQTDTGKEIHQIKTDDGSLLALAFSPDGKTLVSRARNQRIRLWQTDTGKELHQLSDAKTEERHILPLTPSQLVGLFFAPERRVPAFSPDGKQVAAAAGSTVRLWDTATGKEQPLLDGHRGAASSITLSRDGKTVISWGADQVIRRWETATGKTLGAFRAPPGTTRAAFSSEGRTIALANADNTIRLHETATGKELHRIKGHPKGTASLAFTSDGKMLASRGFAADYEENSIRLYDVAKGNELRQIALPARKKDAIDDVDTFSGPRGLGAVLAFSPDGRLLVTPMTHTLDKGDLHGGLVVFNVTTGKAVRTIKLAQEQPITGMAFSPDGLVLATENADWTVTLWEVASGKKQWMLVLGHNNNTIVIDPRSSVDTLAFSVDSQTLTTRGSDWSVHVWDVTTGKEIGKLKGHEGGITTVAFAADGKKLASGSIDTTILIWDTAGLRKDLPKP